MHLLLTLEGVTARMGLEFVVDVTTPETLNQSKIYVRGLTWLADEWSRVLDFGSRVQASGLRVKVEASLLEEELRSNIGALIVTNTIVGFP